ncbi:hypothetical protein ROZALSC1DRAFT_24113 [Rozella allomycis CSF55]|uniref:Uncharacterized protein n=1 Tax=Rozella allomycis (strain CSF55) TaxID=988480 RepID=A0A4V1IZC0_ROZAC|nr:hypothetical protein ROZALSC1DRAFT_24113 [Rozella allomycis CSF55]
MSREQKERKSKIVPKEYHDAADFGIINTVNYLGLQLSENRVEQFLTLIGDHESLLLLHKHCPTPFCLSINGTCVAYDITSKHGIKGSIIKDINQNEVIDVFGEPVQCFGGWNDPKNLKQFMSALGWLHTLRGNGGQYEEPFLKKFEVSCLNEVNLGLLMHVEKQVIYWQFWSGATFDEIRPSARRKDISVAKSYENDASFLLKVANQMVMPVEGLCF